MLKSLRLTNVGPAPTMDLEFGARLNLLTGDNGLGKSFLLDIAWWSLTRKWPAEINPKRVRLFFVVSHPAAPDPRIDETSILCRP